jgi:hypothetical protein
VPEIFTNESNFVCRATRTCLDGLRRSLVSSCVVKLLSPKRGDVLSQQPIGGGKYEAKWNFFWRDCPEASQYHLYVIGPNAINPIVDDDNLKAATYQYRRTSYRIPSRLAKGWSWMVRAKVNGNWGEWSEKRTFDVTPRLSNDEQRRTRKNEAASQVSDYDRSKSKELRGLCPRRTQRRLSDRGDACHRISGEALWPLWQAGREISDHIGRRERPESGSAGID